MFLDDTPTGDLKRLTERQMQQLSMESEVVSNVINLFRNMIPNITERLQEKVSSLFSDHYDNKVQNEINKLYKDNSKLIKGLSFTDKFETLVQVPESFEGNYKDYGALLEKSFGELNTHGFKLISEYQIFLSTFLNNKDAKSALKDHASEYAKWGQTTESYKKPMNSYFNVKNERSRNFIGRVVDNFNELDDVVESTKQLTKYQENKKAVTAESFAVEVRKVVQLLKLLNEQMASADITKVSGPAAKSVAAGAMVVAEFLEFVGMFGYRVNQYRQCTKAMLEQLSSL